MSKLKQTLAAIDAKLNEVQPKTMDDLISTVGKVEGAGDYGYQYHIVRYFGYLQGIRVELVGRSKSHFLPSKDKVYSVFGGIEKYEQAGWSVVTDGKQEQLKENVQVKFN